MVISQGDIWWAALPEPVGSGPGFDRPVVIVQGDTFNRSQIATVVVIPLTSNTRLAAMPGNVFLPSGTTGLPKDSVANVTHVIDSRPEAVATFWRVMNRRLSAAA